MVNLGGLGSPSASSRPRPIISVELGWLFLDGLLIMYGDIFRGVAALSKAALNLPSVEGEGEGKGRGCKKDASSARHTHTHTHTRRFSIAPVFVHKGLSNVPI